MSSGCGAAVQAIKDGNQRGRMKDWKGAVVFFVSAVRKAVDGSLEQAIGHCALCAAHFHAGDGELAVQCALKSAELFAAIPPLLHGTDQHTLEQELLSPTSFEGEDGLTGAPRAAFRLGHIRYAEGDRSSAGEAFQRAAEGQLGHIASQRWKRKCDLSAEYIASRLVEIRAVPNKGLGVVAREDIPAGTLVMKDRPYAKVRGDKSDLHLVLNHLLESTHKRMLREEDTRESIYSLYPSRDVVEKEFEKITPSPEEGGDPYAPALVDDLNHLYHILVCNTFKVDEGEGLWDSAEEISTALFLTASRFNHSCRPNTSYTFEKGLVLLRTVRDISKGEELTIAYIPEYSSTKSRRETLRAKYHFDCTCERCKPPGKKTAEADAEMDAIVCTTNWERGGSPCGGYMTQDAARVFRCCSCSNTKSSEWVDELLASLRRAKHKEGVDPISYVAILLERLHPKNTLCYAAYYEGVKHCIKVKDRSAGVTMAKQCLACLQGAALSPATQMVMWMKGACLSKNVEEQKMMFQRAYHLYRTICIGDEEDVFIDRYGLRGVPGIDELLKPS